MYFKLLHNKKNEKEIKYSTAIDPLAHLLFYYKKVEEDKKTFSQELPGRYIARILYGWGNKKYDKEY